MKAPTYVVFAGVNGAGKSTFYHTDFWKGPSTPRSLVRINSDEIVIESGGNPQLSADQIRAGREALRRIDDCLSHHVSFNQETTLTGRTCLKTIRRAQDEGYRIVLYYIGVASSQLALDRIAHRVSVGGHPVEEEAVRRRYIASMRNLSSVIRLCDEVIVFDNSVEFVALARWTRGALSWVGNIAMRGSWLMEAICDDDIWGA